MARVGGDPAVKSRCQLQRNHRAPQRDALVEPEQCFQCLRFQQPGSDLNAGGLELLGSDGLAGRSWIGVVDDGSKALVAHVPVLDERDGRFLGLIMVGHVYPTLPEQLAAGVTNLLTYLFGSPLTITPGDLIAMGVLGGCVLAVTVLLRPWLFAICQDEEYAKVVWKSLRVRPAKQSLRA